MTLIIFVSLVTSEQACWFVLTITFGDQLDQWIPWRSLGKGESYVIEAKLFFEQLISKSVSKPALGVAILNKKEQLSFLFLNVNCCAIFRTLLHAAHAHGFDCHVQYKYSCGFLYTTFDWSSYLKKYEKIKKK